mgnify:CR=1
MENTKQTQYHAAAYSLQRGLPRYKKQYEMRISEAQPSEEHRIVIKLKHPYAVPAT